MLYQLRIYDEGQMVNRLEMAPVGTEDDVMCFNLPLSAIVDETVIMPRRRRRTRPAREKLERFFDPDRERPILKKLLSTVAPIAISFLTQQLPQWLGDIDLSPPSGTVE